MAAMIVWPVFLWTVRFSQHLQSQKSEGLKLLKLTVYLNAKQRDCDNSGNRFLVHRWLYDATADLSAHAPEHGAVATNHPPFSHF